MVVQHNLTAMNSNRMLGITTNAQAKATEKLSSGYKINRAADDAAGLAISEKMRKQIRGLTQASANAQDGISAVQTAEGALTEVHDMLQRMNELAVKAANGTMSESDRNAIQNEIDQLTTEIDRVATTTKFNETYLLKGANGSFAGSLTFSTVADNVEDATDGTISTRGGVLDAGGTRKIELDDKTGTASLSITEFKSGQGIQLSTVDATEFTSEAAKATAVVGKSVTVGNTTYVLIETTEKATGYTGDGEKMSASAAVKALNDLNDDNLKAFTSMDGLTSAIRRDHGEDLKSVTSSYNKDANGGQGALEIKVEAFADLNDAIDFSLHVGADSSSDNKISVNISMMSARGLGVNGLDISGDDGDNATKSIDIIADALQKVSDQRAALGAVQNRLEHTIANLDNVVENTTSAESSIRDTDMATQMVTYSNNQILAQAGQAMLAQSNQANQGVLSLLG